MINRKPDKDPNALKIASFRTKEGVWADFSAKAESIGLTATDVLKSVMTGFLDGSYNPLNTHTAVSTDTIHNNSVLTTHHDITEIVDTAVSTAVSTLSLCSRDDVSTMISTALVPIEIEIESLKRSSASTSDIPTLETIKTEINLAIGEVESYAKPQLATMREEITQLKKPLAIVR